MYLQYCHCTYSTVTVRTVLLLYCHCTHRTVTVRNVLLLYILNCYRTYFTVTVRAVLLRYARSLYVPVRTSCSPHLLASLGSRGQRQRDNLLLPCSHSDPRPRDAREAEHFLNTARNRMDGYSAIVKSLKNTVGSAEQKETQIKEAPFFYFILRSTKLILVKQYDLVLLKLIFVHVTTWTPLLVPL